MTEPSNDDIDYVMLGGKMVAKVTSDGYVQVLSDDVEVLRTVAVALLAENEKLSRKLTRIRKKSGMLLVMFGAVSSRIPPDSGEPEKVGDLQVNVKGATA